MINSNKNKDLQRLYTSKVEALCKASFDPELPAWRRLSDLTDTFLVGLSKNLDVTNLCIIAIGGYGRAELAPKSDIDIAILLKSSLGVELDSAQKFVQLLWDSGLKASPIIGTQDELLHSLAGHHDRLTAFLDHRLISGNQKTYENFSEGFKDSLCESSIPFFIAAKLKERDENHSRFGNSRYCVEPNIKYGKGGLRDIHALYWILRRLGRVNNQDMLFSSGLLTDEEQEQLRSAYMFLWRIRWNLHILENRPEENLVFDAQLQLAENLGFEGDDRQEKAAAMMGEYFTHSRHICEATRSLCAFLEAQHYAPRLTQARLPATLPDLPVPFILQGQRLAVTHDRAFEENPENAVTLFALSQRHELSIHPEALRRLTARLPALRNDLSRYAYYLPDMLTGKRPEKVLRQMHDIGLLTALLPEFGHLTGLMQYDGYHQYTADEHIITAVGILADMFNPVHLGAGAVATPTLKTRSLMIAMLFHDIGKGQGGDHEQKGADILLSCATRLDLTAQETEHAAFLIRHSGLMGSTAFKKDIHDPKTISDFTATVASLTDLKMLYLLTLADSLAVGEHYWNQWKDGTLKNLYKTAYDVLTGQSADENLAEMVARDYPFLHSIAPASYWRGIDAELLQRHAAVISDCKDPEYGNYHTEILPELGVTQVTVYMPDRTGLFRDLCGALTLADARIVNARIFTFNNRMAIDSFDIQTPNATPLDHTEYLERCLKQALETPEKIESRLAEDLPLRDMPRDFDESTIDFDNNASMTATLMEISTPDRRGLLYMLAQGLVDLKIQIISAKVMTHRHRAVDIFYLKDRFGMKITKPEALRTIRKKLHILLS